MRAAVVFALLLSGCVTRPTGRLYVEEPPTHVELLGAPAGTVWQRLHETLENHQVYIQSERFENGEGYILCEPFTSVVPGTLNTSDYRPGEIVIGKPDDTVPLRHAMEFYLSASPTGLVRVWTDANISADGFRPGAVRAPNIVGHAILDETVKPFVVVKQWRRDRPVRKKPTGG
jgi:hypothetical protein